VEYTASSESINVSAQCDNDVRISLGIYRGLLVIVNSEKLTGLADTAWRMHGLGDPISLHQIKPLTMHRE